MALGSHLAWPAKNEYAVARWALAQRLRSMFETDVLEQSVGINAIFLRSPNVANYNQILDHNTRKRIADFCRGCVAQIIDAVDPSKIVAIGFSTRTFRTSSTRHYQRQRACIDPHGCNCRPSGNCYAPPDWCAGQRGGP